MNMALAVDEQRSPVLALIQEEAVDDVRLGGNLPLWCSVVVAGFGLLVIGIRLAPSSGGFLTMIGGGLLFGLGYAEVITRLPTLTHRWSMSLVLALLIGLPLLLLLWWNASTLPVPPPDPTAIVVPPGR
jgi:hypothetical protein